jgi:hypothetical protein
MTVQIFLKVLGLVLLFIAAFIEVAGVTTDGRGVFFSRFNFLAAGLFFWFLADLIK